MFTALSRNTYQLLSVVIISFSINPDVCADADMHALNLYSQHCASCHGADRLGGTGPALLPENLTRVKKDQAYKAILEGLPATQMPSFQQTLDGTQIRSLADYIYTPLPEMPVWTLKEITQSHILYQLKNPQNDKPVFAALGNRTLPYKQFPPQHGPVRKPPRTFINKGFHV